MILEGEVVMCYLCQKPPRAAVKEAVIPVLSLDSLVIFVLTNFMTYLICFKQYFSFAIFLFPPPKPKQLFNLVLQNAFKLQCRL